MRRDAQVRTPFVIVVQHDRNFMRQVDVRPIVSAMCRHRAWLKYAGLPTGTTIKHAQQCLSRYALRLEHVAALERIIFRATRGNAVFETSSSCCMSLCVKPANKVSRPSITSSFRASGFVKPAWSWISEPVKRSTTLSNPRPER